MRCLLWWPQINLQNNCRSLRGAFQLQLKTIHPTERGSQKIWQDRGTKTIYVKTEMNNSTAAYVVLRSTLKNNNKTFQFGSCIYSEHFSTLINFKSSSLFLVSSSGISKNKRKKELQRQQKQRERKKQKRKVKWDTKSLISKWRSVRSSSCVLHYANRSM